ncbi:MAG: malto-oligosyltrehalose trehalohydrolase [Casimicrobiaceae bacterium]
MRFGAEVEDGATRFRLWAPGARGVSVVLGADGLDARPMEALEQGWFELRVAAAGAGTRYAFRCDGGAEVPDPASRSNPDGVHAFSAVVDPLAFEWRAQDWCGAPWESAVVYELHVGAFTPAGTFAAAAERLDYLADLGVTAVELMPVAAFPGLRNWGYDGVLPYAPACAYGSPEDLKRLVDAAHARGLMMLLDVVYNHFGPDGNYLHTYAPQFFDHSRQTPWGAAIDFDGGHSRAVRDFFRENALYWIDEYRFDGLRLDAVHAIVDASRPDIVTEIASAVQRFAEAEQRAVHVVLENDRNESRRLERDAAGRPRHATAQWNDDVHHALHVLLTGESDGYYTDYATRPLWRFGRCLAEGFGYQGEPSPFRDGAPRGEPSGSLPPAAFVAFTQTHDQVGNRALGERLVALADPRALRAVVACVLLAPAVPMLFMGEEFGASAPFLFFCDFGPELAQAVANGRRAEFAQFHRFRDPAARAAIPDPNEPATFAASRLAWAEANHGAGAAWLAFYRRCLAVRRTELLPRLAGATAGEFAVERDVILRIRWKLGGRATLHLCAHFCDAEAFALDALPGRPIYESDPGLAQGGRWPGHAVAFSIEEEA